MINFEQIKILQGLLLETSLANKYDNVKSLDEVEFSVFSQFGQDGIIAFLTNKLNDYIDNKYFIEIGVENYYESNTRYLLMTKNWSGLVIDADASYVKQITNSYYYWKYDLKAVCSFVSRENISEILVNNLPKGVNRVGLLSIDIDGNDFYILDSIPIKSDILIIEYNSLFGFDRAVVIPYDPHFRRYQVNHTGAYFGASLKAIVMKAEEKGYYFLGTTSAGNDAIFIDKRYADIFSSITPKAFPLKIKFPSIKYSGRMYTINEAIEEIKDLPVLDLQTGQIIKIAELYGL